MLNSHSDEKLLARTGERWENILGDHRQDDNVALCGFGNLAL